MFKSCLLLVWLLLFSVHVHSSGMTCDESYFGDNAPSFLTKKHDYDSYLPHPSYMEGRLRYFAHQNGLVWPARAGYEPEINYTKIFEMAENDKSTYPEVQIELYSEVLSSFSNALSHLRKKDDQITMININHKNFSEENVLRVKELVASLMYYTVLYMKQNGIRYELVNMELRLHTGGNHFYNTQAKKVFDKSGLIVAIDPLALLEAGAAGGYFIERKTIYYKSDFLLSKSIYQSDVGLHEYIHHVDFMLKAMGEIKPYNGRVLVKSTTPKIAKNLSVYKKGFSVDELRTFRATVRVLIHEALTVLNNKELDSSEIETIFEDLYQSVRYYNNKHMHLSHLVRDVYERRIKDPNTANGTIRLSDKEIYDIGVVTQSHAKSTHELAEFLYATTYLFKQQLDAADGNQKDMVRVLKNITKVITIPEVRRMEGNYPSLESVIKTLESKP